MGLVRMLPSILAESSTACGAADAQAAPSDGMKKGPVPRSDPRDGPFAHSGDELRVDRLTL